MIPNYVKRSLQRPKRELLSMDWYVDYQQELGSKIRLL